MTDKKLGADSLERLDRLIAKGRGVRGMSGRVLHTFYMDAFEEWKAGSLDFIQEELGGDSAYYKDFAARVDEVSLSSCDTGIGILTTIRGLMMESLPKEGELLSTAEEVPQESPEEVEPEKQVSEEAKAEEQEEEKAGPEVAKRTGAARKPRRAVEKKPKKRSVRKELSEEEPSTGRGGT